ncbi:MAG: glycosyltransferase [Dysgonamonadaceae bacterium]|nr:glycosyltransferase [Dysgonamonadaceae bacterium]
MSVYNGGKYLKEAIDSILNQTFKDFEFLIVNDASTDSTSAILSQYTDFRIKIIENETNKGLTYSLNLMLAQSRGDYIARMDADDIALPNRLEIQHQFMEMHPEIGICGSFVESFIQGTKKRQIVRFPKTDIEIRAFAFFQSPFCHPSTMFRKKIKDKYHLQYSPLYIKSEDYALWVELLKYTQGATIPQVLLKYRRHEQCFSRWENEKANGKIEMITAIQKNYLACYHIHLDDSNLSVYTQFVDRSLPFELNIRNQKAVAHVIRDFLSQLSLNQKCLEKKAVYNLSMICFFKFWVKKRYPLPFLLQKLFLKGTFIYMKRMAGIKDFN